MTLIKSAGLNCRTSVGAQDARSSLFMEPHWSVGSVALWQPMPPCQAWNRAAIPTFWSRDGGPYFELDRQAAGLLQAQTDWRITTEYVLPSSISCSLTACLLPSTTTVKRRIILYSKLSQPLPPRPAQDGNTYSLAELPSPQMWDDEGVLCIPWHPCWHYCPSTPTPRLHSKREGESSRHLCHRHDCHRHPRPRPYTKRERVRILASAKVTEVCIAMHCNVRSTLSTWPTFLWVPM
jgi:hypothetical protein